MKDTKYGIVYSLRPESGIYLPEAFIANFGSNGRPLYMQRRATESLLDEYGIAYKDTAHKKALDIISQLNVGALESRYNAKGKKYPLSTLLQDAKLKPIIAHRINTELAKFIHIIGHNQLILCDHIERKIELYEIQLNISEKALGTHVILNKTQTGVKYQLKLHLDEKSIDLRVIDIKIITNSPGYIMLGKTIFPIDGINANKLKPFLSKEYIFVANHLVTQYFRDVVTNLAANTTIDATGFDFIESEPIPSPQLSFSRDFINNQYLLNLDFQYGHVKFNGFNKNQLNHVKLNISENGEIQLIKTIRNFELEAKHEKRLEDLGLEKNLANRWFKSHPGDEFGLINFVSRTISQQEFEIIEPLIDGKKVAICDHSIRLDHRVDQSQDWFDIYATIVVGDKNIYFTTLLEYIRKNDRFVPLGDHRFFIIPLEWLEKLETLSHVAEVENGKVKIRKSQYSLLEPTEDNTDFGTNEFKTLNTITDFSIPTLLKATLRPYQKDGALWLINHQINGLGACLADDMGLGKTIQTLTAMLYFKEQLGEVKLPHQNIQLNLFDQVPIANNGLKALIVLPSSLVYNWEKEIKKFAPDLFIRRYTGTRRKDIIRDFDMSDIILTNYQILLRDIDVFLKHEFNYLVLDESQYIKNRDSKIFNAVNQLKSKHKISLSGTPIENSLSDLWSQMQFINPEILGSFGFFKKHFQSPIEKQKDESALLELKKMVDPFILRRTRKDVLNDLPELEEQVIFSEMEEQQSKYYEKVKSSIRNRILALDSEEKSYKFHVFNALTQLRLLSNHPILSDANYQGLSTKTQDVIEYINTILKSGEKVLVFSSFVKHLEIFSQYYRSIGVRFSMLTGSDSTEKREKSIENFKKESDHQIFFISIKAGGVGLNLTEAPYVIILDPWWNPSIEQQAIARAHRMGQQQKVLVTRFITKDTIEEKIMSLQSHKMQLVEDMFGEDGANPDSAEIFEMLF